MIQTLNPSEFIRTFSLSISRSMFDLHLFLICRFIYSLFDIPQCNCTLKVQLKGRDWALIHELRLPIVDIEIMQSIRIMQVSNYVWRLVNLKRLISISELQFGNYCWIPQLKLSLQGLSTKIY